ncbi:selenocysteine-specific translation elongation factor [Clostridium sp. CM027]|uniref:selenocysteine-specific translation elongation factor n=1 Tax=Clostridium sp. CM027 TaxID=2849865 RepID=UPI001C6E995A|nr:selenocysteine-specific translation elongation factor [Clostridium sp. CM027]MBW9145797.1 selenocysteine-specific translation elongation factor [Clostridium sp. CM027]UVE42139.1 selenocysteine-specific translation elongation factor [Clostridium sp. CM027]
MKHIIIGTAGHIDHGKTSLVKALTGRETDTLKEEKDRGISINLGFACFDLPSGRRAGIIDVPGHEKFIKNMLAGVSSIDIVLMVIAADEGIMPQTKEHFEILQLLDVKKGIIVLTKIDMVEEEWLSMVKDDVKEQFKDSFLENAQVHCVSSKTRQGISELACEIDTMTQEVRSKDITGHFRLPVDRVFSVSGFGTVVTGTVISGKIEEGQTVMMYPSKLMSKIRGIQVHDNPVKIAEAGQRCAINLANVKTKDIERGDVISIESVMEPSLMVDCKSYYLLSNSKPLVNRQRVRLYHGTSEIICRVVILDLEEINPGEEAYVQLRLEKPLTAQRNDRFVIRNYSPMYTIGGGSIIEPSAPKAKRFHDDYIEDLKIKESGHSESIIEKTVEKLSSEFPRISDILKSLGKNEGDVQEKLNILVLNQKLLKLKGGDSPVYIHINYLNKKVNTLLKLTSDYHKINPLKLGISKEEIKIKVFGKNIKQKTYDDLLFGLEQKKVINLKSKFIGEYGYEIVLTKEQQSERNTIIKVFEDAHYIPPKYEELLETSKDKKIFTMVFELLLDEEILFKINTECYLLNDYYKEVKDKVKKYIDENESITIAQFKDMMNTNRKYGLILLEHLDGIKFTKRVGDSRVLL